VRLLVKNLGREMPESVVREELEALDIYVQGVMQLRSCRRDQDPTKDRRLNPHFIISVARGPKCHRTLQSASVTGVITGSKRRTAMQALPALALHAA
jgi:hypothetical protein